MRLNPFMFGCLVLFTCFMLQETRNPNNKCKLVTKPNGLFIVCDSKRVPRSKVPDKARSQQKRQNQSRRKKYRLTIKCQDLETAWTDQSNLSEALSTLFGIYCPSNKFLRGMSLNRNETKIQVRYKCCALE